MRFSRDGKTVTFRSTDEWYFKERDGAKPCTLRWLDDEELRLLRSENPAYITIDEGEESFSRLIIGVHEVGKLLGRSLVLICWDDE